MRTMTLACLPLLLLAATPPAPAAEGPDANPTLARLAAKVREVMADPRLRAEAIEAGRLRGTFCFACHGEDGNSRRPHVPKLAGQNPVYLLDQIERFASGRRRTTYMQALARHFTEEDKINLVVYFASQPLRPAGGDPRLAEAGERIYRQRCIGCHGPDARGSRGYARLAGQQPRYVEKTLLDFQREGGRRDSPVMQTMVRDLSRAEIRALAAYLAGLR